MVSLGYRLILLLFLVVTMTTAEAQNKLGGHFGAVIPLATVTEDETTTLSDNFSIGFPMGITVKKSDKIAFDLEIVPVIDEHFVSLLIHPGLLVGLGNSFTFGTRAAFEINQRSFGFTPLLNKSFPLDSDYSGFVEVVFPIRFVEDVTGDNTTALTVGVHFGIGF
ncbi:MAG: hypothetical protein ACE5IY_19245 [bacterium]